MPGCVICFGRYGKIAYCEAFGNSAVEPALVPMTPETVFDMASITKPVVTATCIMKLVEDGKLSLDDRVENVFPGFGANGKEAITIRDLLIHQSGLTPDNAMKDYLQGPELAWENICELGLIGPVGTKFKYSDVNFIVLGKIVEQVGGQSLNDFSREHVFASLGMRDTGFLPGTEQRLRAAPTEKRNGKWIKGFVHDPRSYALGGIAGHAGLFSTAKDMAVYADMMLGGGTSRLNNVNILSSETVREMTAAIRVSSGLRGLGWDIRTAFSSNRGTRLSEKAFGHGGFTGTVIWMDPESDFFFILLSNRLHPDGNGSVNQLSGKIIDIVASAMTEAKNDECILKR